MDREKDVLRDVGAEILDQKHLSDIDMLVDVSDFNRAGLRTELIVTFMVQPEASIRCKPIFI